MPALRRSGAFLAVLIAVAGCDRPTDPAPDPELTISLDAANLMVLPGAEGAVVATVTRSGGSGTVTITSAVAGAGVATSTEDITHEGDVARATIRNTVSIGASAGPRQVTVTASMPGAVDAVATFTVTVAEPPMVVVNFAGCTPPHWFGYQDGDGPVIGLSAVDQVYRFPLRMEKGAYFYVLTGPNGYVTHGVLKGRSELVAAPIPGCGPFPSGTAWGVISGMGQLSRASVTLGAATVSRNANGPITVSAGAGPFNDLVVVTYGSIFSGAPSRMRITRGVPVTTNDLGTIDMSGAALATFAPASATVTLMDNPPFLRWRMSLLTRDECAPALLYDHTSSSRTIWGVPDARLAGNDMHSLTITSGSERSVTVNFHKVAPFELTMGPGAPRPDVTSVDGSHARARIVFDRPPEYRSSATFNLGAFGSVRNQLTFDASAAWLDASASTIVVPDFSATAGWSSSWAVPPAPAPRGWDATIRHTAPGNPCHAGVRERTAGSYGTF